LQRIVNSTSERIDHVRRAAALLAVARTGVFIQAAREAGLHSGTTVADLVARFNITDWRPSALRAVGDAGRRMQPLPARRWRLPRSAHPTGARMAQQRGR
jgi:hypothetical protein